MSFLNKEIERATFGIIVGNRDVFPDHLATEGRTAITDVLKELNYDYVILNKKDTKFGVVETYEDAKKYALLFKVNREKIGGIVVILPNFVSMYIMVRNLLENLLYNCLKAYYETHDVEKYYNTGKNRWLSETVLEITSVV